jgi:hypothetical protein
MPVAYIPFVSLGVDFPMEKLPGRFPQVFHHLHHFHALGSSRLTKMHGFSEVSQSSTAPNWL